MNRLVFARADEILRRGNFGVIASFFWIAKKIMRERACKE